MPHGRPTFAQRISTPTWAIFVHFLQPLSHLPVACSGVPVRVCNHNTVDGIYMHIFKSRTNKFAQLFQICIKLHQPAPSVPLTSTCNTIIVHSCRVREHKFGLDAVDVFYSTMTSTWFFFLVRKHLQQWWGVVSYDVIINCHCVRSGMWIFRRFQKSWNIN